MQRTIIHGAPLRRHVPIVIGRSLFRPEEWYLAWGDDVEEIVRALERRHGRLDMAALRITDSPGCVRFNLEKGSAGGARVLRLTHDPSDMA